MDQSEQRVRIRERDGDSEHAESMLRRLENDEGQQEQDVESMRLPLTPRRMRGNRRRQRDERIASEIGDGREHPTPLAVGHHADPYLAKQLLLIVGGRHPLFRKQHLARPIDQHESRDNLQP